MTEEATGFQTGRAAMIHKLRFDIRDMPLCVKYGLSARNLWVFWKALVLAWLVWAGLIYLGFFAAGDSIPDRWHASRLFPVPEGLFLQSPVSMVFMAIALLVCLWIIMAAYQKVSRITFEQIRGDEFYSGRDALAFHRENWKPLLLVPVAVLAGLAILLAKLFILGLIGRIPAAGPVIVGLLAVPVWGLTLFGVLAVVALVLSVPMVPAVTACTRGDTFETLFELFSSITSQPFRIVLYAVTGLLARLTAIALFIGFARGALALMTLGVGAGMGDQGLASSIQGGTHLVSPQLVSHYGSFLAPLGSLAGGPSGWSGAAGWIAGLSGAAIAVLILAYWFSSCASFWTICYLTLRKAKDGEDLLARADDEEFREFEKRYGSADQAGDVCRDGQ